MQCTANDTFVLAQTDFSQFSFQRYFKAAALMANGIEVLPRLRTQVAGLLPGHV